MDLIISRQTAKYTVPFLLFAGYIVLSYSHFFTLENAKTAGVMFFHTIMTLPSTIYHGLGHCYNRVTHSKPILPNVTHTNLIVFVHGRNGQPADFKGLTDNLQSLTDKYTFVTVGLGKTGYTSIDTDALKLQEQIKQYIGCNITLVGLSKGGVTVMRYATKYNDDRITRVITISSPIKGTYVAHAFPETSEVRKGLGYNNDIVKETIALKNKLNISIHHIVPLWDGLVVPVDSAQYDDTPAENIYYYNGTYSHAGITFNPEVAQAIIKWLC